MDTFIGLMTRTAKSTGIRCLPSCLAVLLSCSGALCAATIHRTQSARLVGEKSGWYLVDNHLFWRNEVTEKWTDVTPPDQHDNQIITSFFSDENHGWLLARRDRSGLALLSTTTDGGTHWLTSPFSGLQPDDSFAWVGSAQLEFVSPSLGYAMFHLASSSNFSLGSMYTTSDGGHSWSRLSDPPSGNRFEFTSADDGWLLGGPAGTRLFFTHSGGQTWEPLPDPIPALAGLRITYSSLPEFSSSRDGELLVRLDAPQQPPRLIRLSTSDNGQTWRLVEDIEPTEDDWNAFGRNVQLIEHFTNLGTSLAARRIIDPDVDKSSPAEATKSSGVLSLVNFHDQNHGWFLVSNTICPDSNNACVLSNRLLATDDGAATFVDITPTVDSTRRNVTQRNPVARVAEDRLKADYNTANSTGRGFDACSAPAQNVMQSWLASPYRDVGIYIGGINRDCPQSQLTPSWIQTVHGYGWDFMPLWVGVEAPCTAYTNKISSVPSTAAQQGASEATAAAQAAVLLGLSDSIIYYDLENYSITNTLCQQRAGITSAQQSIAVTAFVGAWVAGIKAAGFRAGVYGSPYNAADWASATTIPDAVWLSDWNDTPSVFGLAPLADSYWANNQRLHQYWGSSQPCGYSETYGGNNICIDLDVESGPVAVPVGSGGSSTPTDPNITVLANTTQQVKWFYISVNNNAAWYIVDATAASNPSVLLLYSANSAGIVWEPISNYITLNGFPAAGTNFSAISVAGDGRSVTFGNVVGGSTDPNVKALANTTQQVKWFYISVNNNAAWYIVDATAASNPSVLLLYSANSAGIVWEPISNYITLNGFPAAGTNYSSIVPATNGRSIVFGPLE